MKWFIDVYWNCPVPKHEPLPFFLLLLFQAVCHKESEKTIHCQIFIVHPKVTDVPLLVFAVAEEI